MSKYQYELITLDADRIIKDTFSIDVDEYNNNIVTFEINLNDDDIKKVVIRSLDSFADNALFYQMIAALNLSVDKSDCLQNSIVFLDFSNIFNNTTIKPEDCNINMKCDTIQTDKGIPYRIERLVSKGFDIYFEGDKEKHHFISFDKSSSMSRQSRISYIDEKIAKMIDERLLLDIKFTEINLLPCKYYAYRGLYLSSSYRINDIDLNEESVIVLEDEEKLLEGRYFAQIKDDDTCSEKEYKFDICNTSEKTNFYDGEGLICPEYASYISDVLKDEYDFSDSSHSFQIRMPFTKGMLHEVDYNAFFTEMVGDDYELMVNDCFGVCRDIRKAKIILTKSMFKCAKWLRKWCRDINHIEDPMKFFFDKMIKYNHTLYITGTDARLHNNGTVNMNYQFWSTLDLPAKDFVFLMNGYSKNVDEMKGDNCVKSIIRYRPNAESDISPEILGNFDDARNELEDTKTDRMKCICALKKNNAFINDLKVKEIIGDMVRTGTYNLFKGKIEVPGEQRYLSRDLMRLMWYVLNISYVLNGLGERDYIYEEKLSSIRKESYKKLLYRKSRHFYMAKNILKQKADKYYAIFRNPHLSRNEQCILKPLVNSKIYDKYFSHLRGVIMVSYESLVPLALGGADFDGDLVKIVSEPLIVQAVERGAYYCDTKSRKKDFVRKEDYPVIKLSPSSNTGSDEEVKTPEVIPFKVICNTFSNQIGEISNLAVKIAGKEYLGGDKKYKNKCAECTIITGLEIDAAKTGVHPRKNIEAIKQLICKDTNKFLKVKRAISDAGLFKYHIPYSKEIVPGKYNLYRSNPDGSKHIFPLVEEVQYYDSDNSNVTNIERLPGILLRYLYLSRLNDKSKDSRKISSEGICFKFQLNPKWKDELNNEKRGEVLSLLSAYRDIRSKDYFLRKFREVSKKSNYWGHIYRILQIQYDSFDFILPCGFNVEEACAKTFHALCSAMNDSCKVDKALDKLVNTRWHFTCKRNRANLLYEIVGIEKEKNLAMEQLLTNFSNNGYMILYYMLIEIKNRFNAYVDYSSYSEKYDKKPRVDEHDKYYLGLEERYKRDIGLNAAPSLIHRHLNRLCRMYLEDIFKEDGMKNALKYVWSCPKIERKNFFWNVFYEKEILDEMIIVGRDSTC